MPTCCQLLQHCCDLFEHSAVPDQTRATLASKHSTGQMMDAVFSAGQCDLVSRTLNSYGAPPDDFLPGAKSGGAQLRTSPPVRRRR